MKYDLTCCTVSAKAGEALKAAELFACEIEKRTGVLPIISAEKCPPPCVSFTVCGAERLPDKDSFEIEQSGSELEIFAHGIRGFIFGYSYLLRKCEFNRSRVTLIQSIAGKQLPAMKIRGHQCGYRSCPNTYDAWDVDDYRQFYLDIMAFGCNTCEHISSEKKKPSNPLMRFEPLDLTAQAASVADEFDLDVSLWYPNDDKQTLEAALDERREAFKKIPRLNVVFPPGGDPGNMPGDEFVERCIAISNELKKIHLEAEMFPSAQQPHGQINWGNDFIETLEKLPEEIDGVITGPNRAFTLNELRRRLPMKYPIRLYPDITHNVRCEYPVHFNHDDWHYALASCLGRESINPRPTEYRLIHRLTRPYVIGSVSYSEGVNDDVNKAVWSDMDYRPQVSLRETLCDYSRFFMWGVDAEKTADGILGLEQNWQGDPAENPHIECTLKLFRELLSEKPSLIENWRFVMCLFRAQCDALCRRRRLFELKLIDEAKRLLAADKAQEMLNALKTDFDESYYDLRAEISENADRLFNQIGIQLDVENYHADSWERGATLETIDLPITDRPWLVKRLEAADKDNLTQLANKLLYRGKVGKGEYYYSLAEHGLDVLDIRQEGEFYLDFQGDRPDVNNGSLPTGVLKMFDHFKFKARLGGFEPNTDYELRVNYKEGRFDFVTGFYVKVNSHEIYRGKPYGGRRDTDYEKEQLAPKFTSVVYDIPADFIENGCIDLEIGEPYIGVILGEFFITKKQ